MRSFRRLSPLAFAFLFILNRSPEILSSEQQPVEDVRSWMIVLPESNDAEPEVYRIGPLEEGESLQFVTVEGDTIAVERERSRRTIELNGKELETQGHHGTYSITTHLAG
jgi:hypothetical protein